MTPCSSCVGRIRAAEFNCTRCDSPVCWIWRVAGGAHGRAVGVLAGEEGGGEGLQEMQVSHALDDVTDQIRQWQGHAADLYWCPHCGYRIANRVRPLIGNCWGPCLEMYGEPIPLTFVRGLGPGRPESEAPF